MDNTDPYKTKFKEERLYMSTNQNLMQHMRELIDRIKAADVAYYRDDNPTMTDREYDLLVDELKELETTTGLILSGSPTQTVSGEILKELTPVRHTKPMLSADKTKSVDEMLRFANGRPVVLSWKLDGLTLVLRYEGGEFKQAITRGREGIIGEDVTHTVRTFMNVPMCIPCADKFEVRGEGVISWAHFEKLNLSLSEPYSHPRNLAAGSVRMLDARESGKRYLEFFAFDLISDSIEEQSKTAQLQFLAENGFDVVPYGGQKFELTGNAAAAWLNGRFNFAEALGRNETPVIYLQRLGLAETEADNDELSRYRIASRCIFCPADTTGPSVLRAMDKEILQWLKNAGVRLTVAELVYLIENGIKPTQDLLYTDNRQRLIERIYAVDTIADNFLENQMETAKCRDAVVQSLMRLLKKKLVLVL